MTNLIRPLHSPTRSLRIIRAAEVGYPRDQASNLFSIRQIIHQILIPQWTPLSILLPLRLRMMTESRHFHSKMQSKSPKRQLSVVKLMDSSLQNLLVLKQRNKTLGKFLFFQENSKNTILVVH